MVVSDINSWGQTKEEARAGDDGLVADVQSRASGTPVQLEPAFHRSKCRLLQSEGSRRYRIQSRARRPLPADVRDASRKP